MLGHISGRCRVYDRLYEMIRRDHIERLKGVMEGDLFGKQLEFWFSLISYKSMLGL